MEDFYESKLRRSYRLDIDKEIGALKKLKSLGIVIQSSSTKLEDSMNELSKNLENHDLRFPPRKELKTKWMTWRKEAKSEWFAEIERTCLINRIKKKIETQSPGKPLTTSMGTPKYFSSLQGNFRNVRK